MVFCAQMSARTPNFPPHLINLWDITSPCLCVANSSHGWLMHIAIYLLYTNPVLDTLDGFQGGTNLAVVKINMKTKLLTASRQWAMITDGVKKSLTASKVKLQSRKMTMSAPNVKTTKGVELGAWGQGQEVGTRGLDLGQWCSWLETGHFVFLLTSKFWIHTGSTCNQPGPWWGRGTYCCSGQ